MVRVAIIELDSTDGLKLGHVILSISRHQGRTTVKILDRFVKSVDEPRLLVAAGLAYAKRYRADRLLIPEQSNRRITVMMDVGLFRLAVA